MRAGRERRSTSAHPRARPRAPRSPVAVHARARSAVCIGVDDRPGREGRRAAGAEPDVELRRRRAPRARACRPTRRVERHVHPDPVRDADVTVRIELQRGSRSPAGRAAPPGAWTLPVRSRSTASAGRAASTRRACESAPRSEPYERVPDHPAVPVRPLLHEPGVGERSQSPCDRRAGKADGPCELGCRGPDGRSATASRSSTARPSDSCEACLWCSLYEHPSALDGQVAL